MTIPDSEDILASSYNDKTEADGDFEQLPFSLTWPQTQNIIESTTEDADQNVIDGDKSQPKEGEGSENDEQIEGEPTEKGEQQDIENYYASLSDEDYFALVEEEQDRENFEEKEDIQQTNSIHDPDTVDMFKFGRVPVLRRFSLFQSAQRMREEEMKQGPLKPQFWQNPQPILVPFEDEQMPVKLRCGDGSSEQVGPIPIDFDVFQHYAQSDSPERRYV